MWTCKKCGREYKTQEEGWYFTKSGVKKYPCKKCISDYNKTPAQKAKRYAANDRYRKTEKGKLACTLAKYRWLDKKEAEMEERRTVCKGIILRAKVYNGVSSADNRTSLVSTIRLNVLKRESCPGCEQCGGLWDQMSEISNDWPVSNIGDAIDGRKYTLSIVITSHDYETGFPDEWEYKINEVNDD